MKIGYRTIKTAIATPIAVFISQMLDVSNIVAAGILTILCIQPSRKKSVLTAWERFSACLLAVVFSIVFFELLGYSIVTLGLLLAFFIPAAVFLKIDSGILTGTVITLNIFHFGMINTTFIKEQLMLIGIGIGTGLVVNLYMPSMDKQLQSLQKQLEEKFKIIFKEIARFLREETYDWQGKEITDVYDIFEVAEELVERDKENHFFRGTHFYEAYFTMRKRQFSLMKQMLPVVTRIPKEEGFEIAEFFETLSEAIHPGDTSVIYLQKINDLKKRLEEKPLPKTKEELHARANLFQLLFLIEAYLQLKTNYFTYNKKGRQGIFRSRLPL